MPEIRLPCPVCVGAKMVKGSPSGTSWLVLDLCLRCGGIWFEQGEVQAARTAAGLPDPGLRQVVAPPQCPSCHAVVTRSDEACPACGHDLVIDCPSCDEPMHSAHHGEVTLDFCSRCRGVWFDREELTHIWSAALAKVQQRRADYGIGPKHQLIDGFDPGSALIDTLSYSPDLGAIVVEGAVRGTAASLDVVVHAAPEVVGALGEAAGAVFEMLIEAVAAVLSGLSV